MLVSGLVSDSRGSIDAEVLQGRLLGVIVMFSFLTLLPRWAHFVRISCTVYLYANYHCASEPAIGAGFGRLDLLHLSVTMV